MKKVAAGPSFAPDSNPAILPTSPKSRVHELQSARDLSESAQNASSVRARKWSRATLTLEGSRSPPCPTRSHGYQLP